MNPQSQGNKCARTLLLTLKVNETRLQYPAQSLISVWRAGVRSQVNNDKPAAAMATSKPLIGGSAESLPLLIGCWDPMLRTENENSFNFFLSLYLCLCEFLLPG